MVALTARSQELTGTPVFRVGLWIEEPLLRARCRAALAGFAVEDVADAATLDGAAGRPDVVVASWRQGLAELALRLGLRLIVVGDTVPEPLVDALARGLQASLVTGPDALADEVRRFGRAARASDGRRHRIAGATVRLAGVAGPLPLADLSNDGLSFVVDDAPLEPLLPGSELGAVEVLGAGGVCIDGVLARVRHVEPLEPGRYRIGCALHAPPPPPSQVTVVRDRALCAALVRAGARSGIAVEPLERDERAPLDLQLAQPRIDVAGGTITAEADGALPELTLVRGRFEAFGRLYRFTSVVLGRDPFVIKLPATLEESQQRAAARFRPAADEPLSVEVTSMLTGAAAEKPVADLSSTGVSFFIDGARELFPLGLRVAVVLRLPDGEVRARGCVRTLLRDRGRLRCGVELEHLGEAAHARLCDFLVRRRFPAVGDGSGVGFEALWDFFRGAGFLYPVKEAWLEPNIVEIRRSFEALYRGPSKLFKAVVARDGDAITGHVSLVRAYRQTWMSQHLAAAAGRHVGHLLNLGAAEYFGQNPDLEYCKIFFQQDNRWPSRVFGGFARTLRDSAESELRMMRHVMRPVDAPLPPPPGDIEVREADERDLGLVERHFVTRERGLLLRADDLTRGALTLASVDESYARLGLTRRRRVLCAWRQGVCVGFALAELSSPGLNLSEILSSFRTYETWQGEGIASSVRLALVHAVARLYRQAGRAHLVGLPAPEQADDYARMGFVCHDTFFGWTCHRTLYARFCEHVDRLFEVLRRRRARGGEPLVAG